MKKLMAELLPAVLAAVIAVMGAYIAVKEDITVLTVNQGAILESIHEYKGELKDMRLEVHDQDTRIAVLEQKHK